MRILYWTELFAPHVGGTELYVQRLVTHMSRTGDQCAVLTNTTSLARRNHEVHEGVDVYRYPFRRTILQAKPGQVRYLRSVVGNFSDEWRPDVVHIHLSGPSPFFYLLAAGDRPAPIVATAHVSPKIASGGNSIMAKVLQVADLIVAYSDFVRREIVDLNPMHARRIRFIPYGLRLPHGIASPLPFEPPVLLYLGRLSPEKGVDLALRALARIAQEHDAVRMVVAGDGAERAALQDLAEDLAIADRVDFVGWIDPDQVPGLLDMATLVVIPSRGRESLGIVALEAAQMARPVVATSVGGLREIVRHGQTGLLVAEDDAEMMANAISRLLRAPELATRLGRNGRRRVLEAHSEHAFFEAHEDLYTSLYRHGRRSSAPTPPTDLP